MYPLLDDLEPLVAFEGDELELLLELDLLLLEPENEPDLKPLLDDLEELNDPDDLKLEDFPPIAAA